MPDEHYPTASLAYATQQLQRAMAQAVELGDATDRERVRQKVRRWEDVVFGIASGQISVGNRTPVADTPVWVTLEVAHGGFATGRYLAESALDDDEMALLTTLPGDTPGVNERERLNLWFLSDAGQTRLRESLHSGHYRVEIPEEAALSVVVLLLDNDFPEQALDLVAELRPFMNRLRFTPRFESVARLSGAAVRLASATQTAQSLRAVSVPPQIATMRATLAVWNPLYDRLVALWSTTVEGELPHRDGTRAVHGGWPCQQWPPKWAHDRARWLADFEQACSSDEFVGRHAHPKSNFATLHRALESCPNGGETLPAHEVGGIRRALANTITRHGAAGSQHRDTLRATQLRIANAPTYAALARVLARRLDRYPADAGVPSLDSIAAEVTEADETVDSIPTGTPIPQHLLQKATRALEAPVDELVSRGVISSSEVLAIVLPQLTSRLTAASIGDPVLAGLYEQTYTAFRRRRSLLLLNLEHQVRFEELPWIAALQPCRSRHADNAKAARQSLRQASMLALTAFPHTILPNSLIRELGTLATESGLQLPLVEEVAADIFMGTFTSKWRSAAAIASRTMAGTLYADYYDLPPAWFWAARSDAPKRWGKPTAEDFAQVCARRAEEAGATEYQPRNGSWVARNGAILEQSQILTTHNLATLVYELDLLDQLRDSSPQLVRNTFTWVIRRLAQPTHDWHVALIQIKNAAYAWRQAIFLLSFCDPAVQQSQVGLLHDEARAAGIHNQFRPAIDGLDHVIGGKTFAATGTVPAGTGRRFLGWAVGRHWYLPQP
ncbi:hypothetical protein [Mycolicibacterium nivoides]|uniref:hypothetical protein n=1 Tax=Mycolicibacterium nivoides TaxID=2487344 RepID=UPI003C2C20FC